MKVIIAGSRSIDRMSARRWDYDKLVSRIDKAVAESGFEVTEVITGGAGGPDRAGEQWAAKHGIPVTTIKPNWKLGKGAGSKRAPAECFARWGHFLRSCS